MNYERKTKLEIVPVISKISDLMEKFKESEIEEKKKLVGRHDFEGNNVKFLSLRLKTFATKGICCIDCGIKASFFAVERHMGNENYHINLYAVNNNGEEIMMTHDHVIARSLGGADNISNTQTMCTICNSKKSVWENELLRSRSKMKSLA